jgi:hypothetical protein
MLIYVLRWWPSWISDRHKKQKFVEDLPMIIPGQFGFNCPSGFRETLDPMGKMFQNASSLKPLGQMKPNCPGMIIFYADRKSKMAATTGHSTMNIHVQFGFNHICSF